jgi:hypothetical protein
MTLGEYLSSESFPLKQSLMASASAARLQVLGAWIEPNVPWARRDPTRLPSGKLLASETPNNTNREPPEI